MIHKLKKIIEKVDKAGYIESFRQSESELTNELMKKEKNIQRSINLEEKDLKKLLNEYKKRNSLLSELDIEHEIKINNLSLKLYKSIEKTIDNKIDYEIFSKVMRHYKLRYFLTKEISDISPTKEKRISSIYNKDYYNKFSIDELNSEIEELKKSSKNIEELNIAKSVLNNKKQQSIMKGNSEDIQHFKKACSLKGTPELRNIVFDETDYYTENEKAVCRFILNQRSKNQPAIIRTSNI